MKDTPRPKPYDACGGKTEGSVCKFCSPDDKYCTEPAVLPKKVSNKDATSSTKAGKCRNHMKDVNACADYCYSLDSCTGFMYWGNDVSRNGNSGRCCPKATFSQTYTVKRTGVRETGGFFSMPKPVCADPLP